MRLFVAVNFSPEVKASLLRAVNELKAMSPGCNASKAENLHLTLAFIGESRNIAGAKAALDAVSLAPFELSVGGAGRFGDLYWAGADGGGELAALAEAVRRELIARGFDIDRKPFKPHITLARRAVCAEASAPDVPRSEMTVRRISLMKSERINGRLTYTEVYGRALSD